jgi:hypothetical protein
MTSSDGHVACSTPDGRSRLAGPDRQSDEERAAREESAAVRGWLRLADDVLKTSTPEDKAESDQPT